MPDIEAPWIVHRYPKEPAVGKFLTNVPAAWLTELGPALNVTLCVFDPAHVQVTSPPTARVRVAGLKELS